MARPAAKHLTERELELLHVFWRHGELTAAAARDHLDESGTALTYVTVANLVRILQDKGYLAATNDERPFRYQATHSYEEVSGRLLGDVIDRVFAGSAEDLLLRFIERRKLTKRERTMLENILKEGKK
jgi:predicted transcriptional regulator